MQVVNKASICALGLDLLEGKVDKNWRLQAHLLSGDDMGYNKTWEAKARGHRLRDLKSGKASLRQDLL